MQSLKLRFIQHALDSMEERVINEADVRFIVARGVRNPEPADPGAAPRFSCSGMIRGEWLTVIVAAEEEELVVITVFR